MSIRHHLITAVLPLLALALSCERPEVDVPGPLPEDPQEQVKPEEPVVYDGAVVQLMEATAGKGIDIVIMGDGFIEADHKDGTYENTMRTACDHLFSNRPVSELKEYFNVYYVGVVSENRNLDGKSGLKCKDVLPTDNVTEKIVDSYGAKIKGLKVDNTVFCIIINKSANGGWCSHASYEYPKAYAFCPKIPSNHGNQAYRLALVHETIGHGFAKLGDEYTMNGYANASPTSRDSKSLAYSHSCGYDLNITYSTEPEDCPWKDFLEDERYASEKIGFYEGVGYFGKNAYRPTRESLMNVTTGINVDFSAPDRRFVYNKVMQRGENRNPSYEEFVEFDKKKN